MDRHLTWEGCWNARDLGGLPTRDGRSTRWGALVRSESLHRLTAAGWQALEAHGVRTLIDLRNIEQVATEPQHPPPGIATVGVPLEQGLEEDAEYRRWMAEGWLGTPLYYEAFLTRWSDRCARVVAAVATAEPGGVLVHCRMGRDRTGLIVMLLLALAGVSPEDIAADHGLTAERLGQPGAPRVEPHDENAAVQQVLDQANRSREGAIVETLAALDLEDCLLAGGLTRNELHTVRSRLVSS
jgi:protein-tyrosine phosphatase